MYMDIKEITGIKPREKLMLQGAHEVIQLRVVSMGLVNRTLVHPREIFSDPLKDRAAAIVVGAADFPIGDLCSL
jgi:DNA repair protein RadC